MALKKRAKFSRESRYWPLLRQESEGIKLVPKGAISQDPNWHTVKTRIIRFYSVNVRAHEPRKATAPASYPRLNKA